jgi:hypothetical protein
MKRFIERGGRATISASRRHLCRSVAAAALLLAIAGCTSSSLFAGGQKDTATAMPAGEQVGSGGVVIGLLAADEPANLSDGTVDSSYLAGRQAAASLSKVPMTLMIRRYDGKPASLKKLAAEFNTAGAKAIIGPNTDDGTAMLAKELQGKGITIISTGSLADPSQRVFAAGLSPTDEASVAVDEMFNHGYNAIVIATVRGAEGQIYASALANAAVKAKINVQLADFSDAAAGVSKFKELLAAGFKPSAIAFATGPARARDIVAALRADPSLPKLPVVGNSGWSFAPPSAANVGEGWYTTLAHSTLADFGKKFAAASSQQPTVMAAVVYDLVAMAGALPQVVKDDPFQPGVIGNDQGFKGQTGNFVFNGSGQVARTFTVVPIK